LAERSVQSLKRGEIEEEEKHRKPWERGISVESGEAWTKSEDRKRGHPYARYPSFPLVPGDVLVERGSKEMVLKNPVMGYPKGTRESNWGGHRRITGSACFRDESVNENIASRMMNVVKRDKRGDV